MSGENEARKTPTNKQELILYRLDSIDKKLVDLQVLVTQTALQEQRIAELERDSKDNEKLKSDVLVMKEAVRELKDQKKSSDAKWWQILIMILSPIVSAVVVYALAGGFHAN